MVLVIGTLQLAVCIFIVLYEYNKRSISVFFWVVNMIMFCLPHFLGIVSNTSKYSQQVLNKASLFVLLFEMFYLLTRIFILKEKSCNAILDKESLKNEIRNDNVQNRIEYKRIFTLCIIVFLIFTLYFIVRFGSIKNLSWGEIYQASINVNTFQDKILEILKSVSHILYFGISGLFVVGIYKKDKLVSCFTIFLILYYSFITRNRITLLPLLIGIIVIFIVKNKKLRLNQILSFTIMGVLCIYIVYAIWVFRHAGTMENFLEKYTFSTFNTEVFDSILNGEGELALKDIFYYFINIDNNFPGLGQGATYIRLILMLVPTSLCFGLKPNDFAITMSSAYTGNIYNTTYSVHPTFFGDLFANFNFFGVLIGIFWAVLFFILDRYISKKDYIIKILLIVAWGSCMVIMARGSVYNSMYIAVISTIALRVVELFKNKKFVYKK